MKSITYNELRENLKKHLDAVTEKKEVFLLKRSGRLDDVIIVSKTEYDKLRTTIELLKNIS